jgi:hypothetical protein
VIGSRTLNMSRKPISWNELAAKGRAAPDAPEASIPEGFQNRLWERLQNRPAPPGRTWRPSGLGWCAALSIAIAIAIVAFNRDLLDLTHKPNSPLIDELAVIDWTAVDSPL